MRRTFLLIATMMMLKAAAIGQIYYPQGDPHKWQFEVTPYLWLPWVKGTVGIDGFIKDVEGDINATPAKFVNSLKSAFLLKADISHNGFIAFVDYMYVNLESQEKEVTFPRGKYKFLLPSVKTDVLEIAAGGRIQF